MTLVFLYVKFPFMLTRGTIKKLQLSQVAENIFQGLSPSRRRKKTNNSSRKVPVINIKDIVDGQIKVDGLGDILVDINKDIGRYTVRAADVVITCRGTVLKSAVVPANLTGCLIASNLIAIRLKEDFEPSLLSIFFQSPMGQKILLSSAKSSTMQVALTVLDIEKIKVPDIPIDHQKQLAKLVSATDQHYQIAIESANLRREIAYNIVYKSFLQSSHPMEAKDE